MILPDLVRPAGGVDLSPGNHRLIAGLLAALVAWRTRNTWLTIATGLAALWMLSVLQSVV
jgi:branched-subunit amino acid transport protein